MTGEWQAAYLAVSVMLGEPLDDALLRLDAAHGAGLQALLRDLRSSSRDTRARAMARVVSEVSLALDDARLA